MNAPPRERVPCLMCGSPECDEYITTNVHMSVDNDETFTFVQCRVCGLVYLSPRVPAAEIGRYYPDYYLSYRGPGAWGRFAPIASRGLAITDRKRVRVARRALSANRQPRRGGSDSVLDIGCGQPTFLEAMRRSEPHGRYVGVDFVSSGWSAEPERWQGLTLVEGEPAAYTPDSSPQALAPDLITMWHYLEHDYAPRETLTHMREIAHDETRLVIEVPHLNSLSRLLYGKSWQGWHTPRHTALYTRATLTKLLESSGWKVESYTYNGTLDIYALWWMSAMQRRRIDWSESFERRFPAFMLGRVLTTPLALLSSVVPLGVQLVRASPQTR